MEADVLRLILLAMGGMLVVGIYLWDRYKRSRTRLRGLSARKAHKQPLFTAEELEPEQQELPHMNAVDVGDVAPVQLTEQNQVLEEEEGLESARDFSALNETDYVHLSSELETELPRMMIQIGLVNKAGNYKLEEIQAAMKETGMEHGEMGIYHRYQKKPGKGVLFSVASMVEPGNFPKNNAPEFETPGLLMFTQLPGVDDGLVIYSDMLYTAEHLLAILGGTLQDESHSALSKQQVEHTRDLILEHRRKVQLARMK